MPPSPPIAPAPRRRRRRPEEAEAEILQAAAQLLRERPAAQVTVAAIMQRTTLSRKSFYVYFRDRHDLITRLVAPLRSQLDELTQRSTDLHRPDDSREAFLGVARMYARHGPLLRALAEASREDPEAARVWREFTDPPIAVVTDRVRQEIAAGRAAPFLDLERTIRALVAMNLATFFDTLAGRPDADPALVVDTLIEIWRRALYGPPATDTEAPTGR